MNDLHLLKKGKNNCKIINLSSGIILLFVLMINTVFAQNYTISRFDYTFCENSFPTSYVTGSFSITETDFAGNNGFTHNQHDKDIIIELPANFEFKTVGTTASVTINAGTDVSFHNPWSFVGTNQIRVRLITGNPRAGNLVTLSFNDFEIRATAASSGDILRNGGNLQIDNAAGNPSSTESFGTLVASSPFSFTSITTTNSNTTNVTQYSSNNEILRIKITGTGGCLSEITQFDLNTDGGDGTGTNLISNLTKAKIYYTGTSSTFATDNCYGTYNNPNGAFSITGILGLVNGDNYFWLTYDIAGDANTGVGNNKIDSKVTSVVINGTTHNDGASPAGGRTIIPATFYYSRFDGNWTTADIWSNTDGGGTCSCQPNGAGIAVIKNAIKLNEDRTVDAVEIRNGAILTSEHNDVLTVKSNLTTLGSGYFNLSDAIEVSGQMTLSGTGISRSNHEIRINGDLDCGVNTTLRCTSGADRIRIYGNAVINGTVEHTGGDDIEFRGAGIFNLSGTGTINTNTNRFRFRDGEKHILAGSNLTINGYVLVSDPFKVRNFGTVSISDDIDGDDVSSEWSNEADAILYYSGTNAPFFTTGIMNASGTNNKVYYRRAGNQTVKKPNKSGKTYYWDLIAEGTATKVLNNNITIYGDLTIDGSAQIDVGSGLNYSIEVKGNWTNTSNNASPFVERNGTVVFSGTNDQTITNANTETFYNLNNDKATGKLILANNAIVSNNLTLTNGAIDLNNNTLTVNNSATTAISRTNGYIISENSSNFSKLKWNIASTTGSHIFPFGKTDGSYIPFTLDLTGGTIGNVTISTYPTASNNTPLPILPNAVSHIKDTQNNDNSANTVDRFWQIDKDGVSGTATLTFTYAPAEKPSSDPAILKAQRWNTITNKWDAPLALQTNLATAYWVTVPSVTTFSPWALASGDPGDNPLPVTLLEFKAELKNNTVETKWKTATEINNDYFTVEKSIDNKNFTEVDIVKGAGNSNSIITYYLKDNEPFLGISYYRLKQTDFDGKYSYSKSVAITNNNSSLKISPNPVTFGKITVSNLYEENEQYILKVYNLDGKEVFSNNGSFNNFSTDVYLNIERGIYYVKVQTRKQTLNEKIVVF